MIDTVSAGYGASRVIFSPDGTRAYVPNDIAGTITVIHTDDDTVGPSWTSAPRRLLALLRPAVQPGRASAVPPRLHGGTVRVLDTRPTPSGTRSRSTAPNGVVFSPDGSRAYVVSGNDQLETLTVIRTADQSVVRLPPARSTARWCSARTAAVPIS